MSWALAELAREPWVLCDGASTRRPVAASAAAPAGPIRMRAAPAAPRPALARSPTNGIALIVDTVRRLGSADRTEIVRRSGLTWGTVQTLLPIAVRGAWLDVDKRRLPYVYRLPAVPQP